MAVTIDGTNGVSGPINVTTDSVKLDGNYPTGTNNVALGDTALDSNVSGASNTAIGSGALTANTVSFNTAVGATALLANTTGTANTALGMAALVTNETGSGNTAVGYASLYNTTASNNTAVGREALAANTTGSANVAVGQSALAANTTGANNTAVGDSAGYSNTTSSFNTFVGMQAGYYTTGQENTFVGRRSGGAAGSLVTTGSKNTIIGGYNGNQGGLDIRTSSNNIVLSDGDGNPRMIVASTGNIAMGNETNPNTGTPTNGITFTGTEGDGAYINLGHNNTATGYSYLRFIYNDNKIGAIDQNGTTGVTYATSSDYRLKENVTDITDGIDRLKQLPVHKFNFIAEPDRTVDGFLAHEAQAVVPEAVSGTKDEVDDEGNPVMQGIDQSKLVPLLTAALKEAITEIETLKERVTALENQ